MQLLTALARHERRIRLLFDAQLSATALSDVARYGVTGPDGALVPVAGLVVVAAQPHAVDLALARDLAAGVAYTVAAGSVLSSDGTRTPPDASARVTLGVPGGAVSNAELAASDLDELLYGVDLVWTGADYAEDASGDLAVVSGPANAQAALERRLTSDGLPWDDTYGAKPRGFIDGAPVAAASLRGTLVRQAQKDDRVKTARATLVLSDADATFDVEADLVGDGDQARVTVRPNART